MKKALRTPRHTKEDRLCSLALARSNCVSHDLRLAIIIVTQGTTAETWRSSCRPQRVVVSLWCLLLYTVNNKKTIVKNKTKNALCVFRVGNRARSVCVCGAAAQWPTGAIRVQYISKGENRHSKFWRIRRRERERGE